MLNINDKMNTMANVLTAEESFNNSIIRNVTVIFGSLFSDIKIRKYNTDGTISKKKTLVPITYASKAQYNLWADQQMRLPTGNIEINTKLPRLSFEMTGFSLATDRGINMNIPFTAKEILANGMQLRSHAPVPYNFNFELIAWTKQMDDSVQILEQIIPYFTPEISIKVKESKKMNIVNDVRIVLDSCSKNDNYQNGFDENRIIQWSMNFTVHADFIPMATESPVIHRAIIETSEVIIDEHLKGGDPFHIRTPYDIETVEKSHGI